MMLPVIRILTVTAFLCIAVSNVPAQTKSIDLAGLAKPGAPGWEPFNGAAFTTSVESGKTVVSSRPKAGKADRGAYLKDITFSEGIIELDLKGANRPGGSFLGVAFHGTDGSHYDAVYFRPFNFRHADATRRSHAVQYMSHPDWPWDKLRQQRNGQFEKSAAPEPGPTAWFHAKIEVKNKRIRVFVNGNAKPCLDVEKMSTTSNGKIGLWFNGIASFANLKITPGK